MAVVLTPNKALSSPIPIRGSFRLGVGVGFGWGSGCGLGVGSNSFSFF
jgi:hypothetical protein